MDYGSRIRDYRILKNLEQEQLASELGVTQQTVSNYEKGKTDPGIATLEKMCSILGITMMEFFAVDQDVSALPSDVYEFIIQKDNQDLIRFIAEMKNLGYSNEGITEWLQNLKNTVEGLVRKGLISGKAVIFDPEIEEDTDKLLADFLERKQQK